MKIIPAEGLHCAVGKDGKIDVDLVRRGAANAQYVAGQVTGKPWPVLARLGWSIVPVRVVYAGAPDAPTEAPAPPPPPPPAPARARGPERMSAAEYRRMVGADVAPVLRCGRGAKAAV